MSFDLSFLLADKPAPKMTLEEAKAASEVAFAKIAEAKSVQKLVGGSGLTAAAVRDWWHAVDREQELDPVFQAQLAALDACDAQGGKAAAPVTPPPARLSIEAEAYRAQLRARKAGGK